MTTAEALVMALECANGQVLVMQVDARPHVITDSGALRDIGSAEMTAGAIQALLTELVPEDARLALHRDRRITVPLTVAGRPDHVLTVDYADSRFSLRLERQVSQPTGAAATEGPAPGQPPDPPPAPRPPDEDLEGWIAAAAGVGATQLYVRAGSPPVVRLSNGIRPLAERITSPREIHSACQRLQSPDGGWEVAGEGYKRIDGTGTIAHCVTFTDVSGAGLTIRIQAPDILNEIAADLPPLARELGWGFDGLALASAPTRREVTPVLAALSTWIVRHRAVHLISVERDIEAAIRSSAAFVSQRRVGGTEADFLEAVNRAAAESPDVLVLEDIASVEVLDAAIAAARDGCLVIAGVRARDSVEALQKLVRGANESEQVAIASKLATVWRGSFTRRLLPRRAGGRVSVCDTLLAIPPVTQHLIELDFPGIRHAQSLRRRGMRTLDDALARVVQRKSVVGRVAAMYASDRAELAAALRNRRRRARSTGQRAAWRSAETPVVARPAIRFAESRIQAS